MAFSWAFCKQEPLVSQESLEVGRCTQSSVLERLQKSRGAGKRSTVDGVDEVNSSFRGAGSSGAVCFLFDRRTACPHEMTCFSW